MGTIQKSLQQQAQSTYIRESFTYFYSRIMHIDFDTLPNNARLWIYQCSRELSSEETATAKAMLETFTANWQTHGTPLRASFKLSYGRFLILGVDADHHAPSGCSIDASVAIVKQLEQRFNVSFFERTKIPFLLGDRIEVVPMHSIKSQVEAGQITPTTTTFNNLIDSKEKLETAWKVPAKDTWLSRYF